MKKFLLILALLIIVNLSLAVPSQISFQGRLTDDVGTPIEGFDDITFSIYDLAAGGSPLWNETRNVEFRNGLYHLILGEVEPITEDIFDGSIVYIELSIGGEIVSPRQAMVTVPYAFRAGAIDTFWLSEYLDDHGGSFTHIDSINLVDSITYISHIDNIDSIDFIDYIALIDSIMYIDSIGYVDSIGWIGYTDWAGHVYWDSIVGMPDGVPGFNRMRADANSWLGDSVTLVSGTNVTLVQDGDSITFNATGGSGEDSDWQVIGDEMFSIPTDGVGINTATLDANTQLTVLAESGATTKAIVGRNPTGAEGWLGTTIYGAYGEFDPLNYGYLGASGYGIFAKGELHAGYFDGAVTIANTFGINTDIIDAEGSTDNIDFHANLDLYGHYINNSDDTYFSGDVVFNDDIVPNNPAQDLGKAGAEWDELNLSGGINVPSSAFINIAGDVGSDDVLMSDASGNIYWGAGSGGSSGVSSLNALTGDLNIIGEGGVDVTASGSNIYVNMTVDPGDCPTVVDMTGGSTSNQYVPLNIQTPTQSIAQFIIPSSEIGCTGGRIYNMTLIATATSGSVSDVDVWVDNVLVSDLSAGTIFPIGSPALDGVTLTINPDNTVDFAFPRGFRYDGDNILVTMRKNSLDGAFSSWTGTATAAVLGRYNSTTADFPLSTTANFRPDVILDFLAPELPDIVNNVNAITGAVTIAGGTGVTVSESGSTITIDASGGGSSLWTDGGTFIQPSTSPTFIIEDDGDLDLGGRNIENVYEFSANSIDPVLKINDKLYRTWTLDMVGQRTEVVGTATIGDNGTWAIDLSNQPIASDLWLFFKAVDEKTIISFASPHYPANLYARVEGSKFIVGDSDFNPNNPVTFSYRLIGVRNDFRDMTPEVTNTRNKPSDVYIDIDSGAKYRNYE